jgi:hypothetical protein
MVNRSRIEEDYTVAEITAVGVTFRNRLGWPYNMRGSDWDKLGKPVKLRVVATPVGTQTIE